MIANAIQTNFTAGEVSPQLLGRVDINKYFNGVKQLLNFTVRPQGGIIRRSGTRCIGLTKDSTNPSRLIRFQFSSIQSYILEFGDLYMRVYKDGARVGSVELVTPWNWDDLPLLTYTQSADVLYVAHPLFQTRKISRTSHTSWQISLYDPEDGPYMDRETDSANQLTVTVTSDISTLRTEVDTFAAGDVNKIVTFQWHGVWKPAKIVAYLDTKQVQVKELEFKESNPGALTNTEQHDYGQGNLFYMVCDHSGFFDRTFNNRYVQLNSPISSAYLKYFKCQYYNDATHLCLGGAALVDNILLNDRVIRLSDRQVTLTIKAPADLFMATDVGRWIRLNFADSWVPAKITVFTSTTQVTATSKVSIPTDETNGDIIVNSGITDTYRLGAWSETTGWPSQIQFYEQRLYFANNFAQPIGIWASVAGDYENMAPSDLVSKVLDSSALTIIVACNQADPIMWLCSGPVLMIGTQGNEFTLKANNLSEAITPTNFMAPRQTSFGSINHIPVRAGTTTLFIQRAGNKIRELTYNFQIDQYEAKDITVVSEHILRQGGGAVLATLLAEPANIIWVLLANGTLAALTYERDQDVIAWHRHTIQGGTVESIESVPSVDGKSSDLYLIVRRQVGGVSKRFIERLEVDFTSTVLSSAFFVDCGISYSGNATLSPNGFDLLNGETVDVIADGIYIGKKVVGGGAVALSTPASIVHVGYTLTSNVEFLPWEGGSPAGGTSQIKMKRIHKLGMRIGSAVEFSYGQTNSKSPYIKIFPGLFSGDAVLALDTHWDTSATVSITVTKPYPLNLLMVAPVFNTTE